MQLESGQWIHLHDAVPVFANASDSFIALNFIWEQEGWDAVAGPSVARDRFRCTSHDGKVSVPVEWFGGELETKRVWYHKNFAGRCKWPHTEKWTTCHNLTVVEEGHGPIGGPVQACHDPALADEGPFRLTSCGKQMWDDPEQPYYAQSVALPPWVEYNLMHGVEHFFWYTDSTTQPAMYAAMEPYFEMGVATRIHADSPQSDHWHNDWMGVNDCLYRTMYRADWMLPSLDPDEYLRPAPSVAGDTPRNFPEVFDDLAEMFADITDISFGGYRFLKADGPTTIPLTSTRRQLGPQNETQVMGRLVPKFAARPWAMRTIYPHFPVSRAPGSQTLGVPPEVLAFNHYRTRDPEGIDTTDVGLANLTETISQRLQERFQKPWDQMAQELPSMTKGTIEYGTPSGTSPTEEDIREG